MFKLNNKLITYYSSLLTPFGFRLSTTNLTFSAQINGFDMCMNILNVQAPYNFNLVTNATSSTPITELERTNFIKSFPSLINFTFSNSKITLSFKKMNPEQGKIELQAILNDFLCLLASHNYFACCENCKRTLPTCDFVFQSSSHMQLCNECANTFASSMVVKKSQRDMQRENIPLGILGSFIGTLIGMLVIFLIARLGYVSIIGGFAMGFCSIYGYYLLSKKISPVGIITSIVLMIVGVFFINKINFVYEFSKALKPYGYTFKSCWSDFNYLLNIGKGNSDYIVELVKVYIFTGLGAVFSIIAVAGNYKSKHDMFLVGGPYTNINFFNSQNKQ